MCTSLVHVVFLIVLLVALLFLMIGTFTPWWKKMTYSTGTGSFDTGLVTTGNKDWCQSGSGSSAVTFVQNKINSAVDLNFTGWSKSESYCQIQQQYLADWEKATFGLLLAALVLCVGAIIWAFFTCLIMCCCHPKLMWPMAMMTSLAFVLTTAAIIVYGAEMPGQKIQWSSGTNAFFNSVQSLSNSLGKSFIITAIGAAILLASSLVACCLSKMHLDDADSAK